MKLTPTFRKWSHVARGAVLASSILLGVSQAPRAMADTLLLSDTALVKGSSTATFSFDAPSAGTVTATVSNLPWPSSLQTLSFSATTASDVIRPWTSALGSSQTLTESFQVGPGTYFAHIMATAAQGDLDLGLYSLNLTFTPNAVPLPTSGWMLLSGVLVLFGLTRVMGMFARFQAPRQEPTLAV
jgi:hypothetical protein